MKRSCRVCSHMEAKTMDRFLSLPAGSPGKRDPRSLAPVFGVDRCAIATHAKKCLVGERRERGEADLERLGGGGIPNG